MNQANGSRWLAPGLALLLTVTAAGISPAEQPSDLHQQLKDPSPSVRAKAAVALAEDSDADAIPVLIDLLAELPAAERQPIEELLTALAGEWAPIAKLRSDDRIARNILRDAWRVWWRNTDGEALLGVVREHTLTPQMKQNVEQLIRKLGDDEYQTREASSRELLRLGRISLPQLHDAVSNRDPEIAHRVRDLIERIEREPTRVLPGAALRLLALRKPEGAAEALLAYLPFAEQDDRTDEVTKTLAILAVRDGKLDAALVRALADSLPRIRAAAAEALVQGGGKQGRDAVRALLNDKAPAVRLRVALALAPSGEREAVPVLIDLLVSASEEQVGQVEAILTQLAGETAPDTSWGTATSDKIKCRDAWAAWWKSNRERADLSRLKTQLWYGYTLLCDSGRNRVFEIDRSGKERWAIEGVPFPVDAWVVGGKHVLIAEYSGRKVSERDFKGKVLWSRGLNGLPVNVQRLSNGHTFIATLNQILELDRNGKEVYSINNIVGGITAAYRARDGRIICVANNGSRCLTLDTTGKQLKQFASNRDASWTSGIDLLSNGRILITQPNRNKVTEYDRDGKRIVEVNAPLATTATGLPNGHFLIASNNGRRAFEVDRTGKVVWEHKAAGNIFRARRR
ncbi:MAG TPA: HEAT repeat domain-containing protein [Gemmataceae bacterium]|nr:HEAT repeat domain-containing protein [Gemmataceae bacterium]